MPILILFENELQERFQTIRHKNYNFRSFFFYYVSGKPVIRLVLSQQKLSDKKYFEILRHMFMPEIILFQPPTHNGFWTITKRLPGMQICPNRPTRIMSKCSLVVMYYTPGHLCPGCGTSLLTILWKSFLEQSDCTKGF